MNKIKDVNDSEECSTIGRELAKLRVQLNMTQQQFADTIHTSRITLNKVERVSEITPDFAYRIFYATVKIVGNYYIPAQIREHALYLQKRVEKEIILKEESNSGVKYNPILYTLNEEKSTPKNCLDR